MLPVSLGILICCLVSLIIKASVISSMNNGGGRMEVIAKLEAIPCNGTVRIVATPTLILKLVNLEAILINSRPAHVLILRHNGKTL